MTTAPKNLSCSLFAKLIPFGISMILSAGIAHADTATATAQSANGQAEDLVVLSQLPKANQNQNSQNQQNQTNTQPTTQSNTPAVASDKLILNHPVIDEAHVLTASEKAHLENQLRTIYNDGLAQMAIVIVPTTGNVDIFDYAITTANRWGLGKKDADDGILMLVAINDRKIFTVTGYGVEGVLPDAFLSRITREDITPSFKSGQYAQGLSAGIARIDERLRADPDTLAKTDKAQENQTSSEFGVLPLFIFSLFFGSFMTAILGRFFGATLSAGGFAVLAMLFGAGFFVALVASFILWVLLLLGVASTGRGRRGGRGIVISGGGFGGGGFGGGGFGGGGFGGGGFSGGGGSFGGGGAGGSW